MDIEFFTRPQPIDEKDYVKISNEAVFYLDNPKYTQNVFNALHTYFYSQQYKSAVIAQYARTYWRWYVMATWERYEFLDPKLFCMIFTYQLPTAFTLDVKLENHLLQYWHLRRWDSDLIQSTYKTIQENVQKIDYRLDPSDEESVTLQAVFDFLAKQESKTSLERASFYSDVQRALYPVDDEIQYADSEKQVENVNAFLELLDFFRTDHDPVEAVETYHDAVYRPSLDIQVDPEVLLPGEGIALEEWIRLFRASEEAADDQADFPLEKILPPEEESEEDKEEQTEARIAEEKRIDEEVEQLMAAQHPQQEKLEISAAESLGLVDAVSVQPDVAKEFTGTAAHLSTTVDSPSFKEIKRMVLDRFPMLADDQPLNVESIIHYLDELASQYRNPDIRDLYYFDEHKGKFAWNSQLLNK